MRKISTLEGNNFGLKLKKKQMLEARSHKILAKLRLVFGNT